mmetsp:Transcript_9973/g.41308  ORF Transcript_9973/g.41308 Transcript_9973/m.41308 type:complete len:310 (-) Transcript_9973:44-973(-)
MPPRKRSARSPSPPFSPSPSSSPSPPPPLRLVPAAGSASPSRRASAASASTAAAASASPAATSTSKRRRYSSPVPTTRRSPSGWSASDQTSPRHACSTCTQCRVATCHTRTMPSFEPEASHAPLPPPLVLARALDPARPAVCAPYASRNARQVTCPRWPLRRHTPASASASHTTTSPSAAPLASAAPSAEPASAVTGRRWPRSCARHPPSLSHTRTWPSAYPAMSSRSERACAPASASRLVHSGRRSCPPTPLVLPSCARLAASSPARTDHTLTRSTAATATAAPSASANATPPPPRALDTTPQSALCS